MTSQHEIDRAHEALDEATVCTTCGANFETYMDGSKCTADLDAKCMGFRVVDAAMCDILEATAHVPASAIPMWVVYDKPVDFPTVVVARLWLTLPEPRATLHVVVDHDIERMRARMLQAGFHRLGREAMDDPKIVETWIA